LTGGLFAAPSIPIVPVTHKPMDPEARQWLIDLECEVRIAQTHPFSCLFIGCVQLKVNTSHACNYKNSLLCFEFNNVYTTVLHSPLLLLCIYTLELGYCCQEILVDMCQGKSHPVTLLGIHLLMQ